MDASAVTGLVKQLQEANTPVKPDTDNAEQAQQSKNETILRILKELQTGVVATEDLLRASKAGVAVAKLRSHSDGSIVALSKEIVKSWKDTVDIAKKAKKAKEGSSAPAGEVKKEGDNKRKREEESGAGGSGSGSGEVKNEVKKVKGEETESPGAGVKDESKVKGEGDAVKEESPARPPLSTIDSTRKVPRTAKADNLTGSLKPSPDDGDDQRAKCVVLLYDALAGDSTAEKRLLKERAQGIERAVWERFEQSSGNDYRQKMRTLYLNLKDKQNPALRNEIVLNYITAEQVANMSKDEMASESVRAMNEKIASENLFKAKAVGETQAETDAFKCGRCQQRKCTYYQMQTRSADEPMTTFVTCTNCGNRWKFS